MQYGATTAKSSLMKPVWLKAGSNYFLDARWAWKCVGLRLDYPIF